LSNRMGFADLSPEAGGSDRIGKAGRACAPPPR
jgi:hypothetical protein